MSNWISEEIEADMKREKEELKNLMLA